jgi:ferritin-like metal-binding protein YciE
MGFLTPNQIKGFQSLYTIQLRHLLSSENQIVKGLEKTIEAASDPQLKEAFQSHLQETQVHAQRLEDILNDTLGNAEDKKCAVTAQLISAGETIVRESDEGAVRDAGLIAGAQKIEHFEIASYGSARDWALLLGRREHAAMLQKSLEEEKHADSVLIKISQRANQDAVRETAAA